MPSRSKKIAREVAKLPSIPKNLVSLFPWIANSSVVATASCAMRMTATLIPTGGAGRGSDGLRMFAREGTAFGVVQRFQELGLRFPRRAYGGAWSARSVDYRTAG